MIKTPATGDSRGMVRDHEPPPGEVHHDTIPLAGDIALLRLRAAVHARLLGTVERPISVDRYTILELLGAGGMGVVYAAHDRELDRKVAVKLLAAGATEPGTGGGATADHHARLLREAQAMARLSHPNVVQVYDVGAREGRVFIAMELIEGETLSRWLAAAPRGWQAVLEKFLAAGRGLSAAHRAGLVHRDFKPDNVLLDREGRARVADFGLVGAAGEAGGSSQVARTLEVATATPLTLAGAIVGTPLYMSPEQHLGGRTDERSDQYSFCVALHAALCGQHPFADDDVAALREAVLRGEPRRPPSHGGAPRRLFAALRRGMSRDAGRRFATMDALLRELEGSRSRWLARWLVGLGAALVVVIGYAATRAPGPAACAAQGRLDGVWDPPRRAALLTRALAVAPGVAATLGPEAVATLDAYAGRWSAAWQEDCAQAPDAASGRQALARRLCLEGRRSELAATVELLLAADETMVRNAPQVLASLPDLAACKDDRTALFQVASATDLDAVTGPVAQQLRRDLTRARALWYVGEHAEAFALADRTREQALAADAPALAAEAGVLAVQIVVFKPTRQALGDLPRRLQAARRLAETSANHGVLARVDVLQVFAEAENASFEHVREALLRSEPRVTAARDPEAIWLLHYFLSWPMVSPDRAEQRRHLAAAAAISDASFGPGHAYTQATRSARATEAPGDGQDALRSNIDELRRMDGPVSPRVAEATRQLALAHQRSEQWDEAIAAYQETIRLWTELRGADALEVGTMWPRLAAVQRRAGDLPAAEASLLRAVEVYRGNPPADSQGMSLPLSTSLQSLAMLQFELGHHEQALATARRAHAACEELPREDLTCDRHALDEAELLLRVGRPAAALERLAAVDRGAWAGESELARMFSTREGLELAQGEALLALDRPAEAIAPLERALALIDDPPPQRAQLTGPQRAQVNFALARAHAGSDAGDRRAREFAVAARVALLGLSEPQRTAIAAWVSLAAVDGWLAAHAERAEAAP